MGRHARFREWGWLVYPLLVGIGLKLVTQDYKHSRPATLFIALDLYGAALIVAPRLRRRVEKVTAQSAAWIAADGGLDAPTPRSTSRSAPGIGAVRRRHHRSARCESASSGYRWRRVFLVIFAGREQPDHSQQHGKRSKHQDDRHQRAFLAEEWQVVAQQSLARLLVRRRWISRPAGLGDHRVARLHPARRRSSHAGWCQPGDPTKKARRWVVQVCHSWFNRFRKLLARYEKLERSFMALNHIAAAIIAFRKVELTVNTIYG
jgi:hypothetical protein